MITMSRLAALLILASVALACANAPAEARWGDQQDQRDQHRNPHDWNGGYRRPPPVIYAQPNRVGPYGGYGYVPPPVIYAPSIGLVLPNLFLGIR